MEVPNVAERLAASLGSLAEVQGRGAKGYDLFFEGQEFKIFKGNHLRNQTPKEMLFFHANLRRAPQCHPNKALLGDDGG